MVDVEKKQICRITHTHTEQHIYVSSQIIIKSEWLALVFRWINTCLRLHSRGNNSNDKWFSHVTYICHSIYLSSYSVWRNVTIDSNNTFAPTFELYGMLKLNRCHIFLTIQCMCLLIIYSINISHWYWIKFTFREENQLCMTDSQKPYTINTLRPRRNCHHFADDIYKCIFVNNKNI